MVVPMKKFRERAHVEVLGIGPWVKSVPGTAHLIKYVGWPT